MGDIADLREFICTECQPPERAASCSGFDSTPLSCSTEGTLCSGVLNSSRVVYTMELDLLKLFCHCPDAAIIALESFSNLLAAIRSEVISVLQGTPLSNVQSCELCIRPTHIPSVIVSQSARYASTQNGSLTILTGTIIRICAKRVVPYKYHMQCPICKKETEVYSDPFNRSTAPKPRCDAKGCKSVALAGIGQVWMDYTECRVQQRIQENDVSGRLPRSVLVTLDDDLASRFSAGQFVEVAGISKPRWRNIYAKAVPQIELVVWAQNVTVRDDSIPIMTNETLDGENLHNTGEFSPEQFAEDFTGPNGQRGMLRAALIRSTCPQLCGVIAPRLGILLAAVGGAEVRDEKTGHRIRGTVHCLLVGDPSTGKSQMLRFAASIAPRAVITTGFTSTNAGLTAAATKEFGEWVLEPGALVQSDGGSCVIDELRTVSAADRTALHEAMEQQTISVAKAGLVAKLRTECSVIAACNPPMKRGSTRCMVSDGSTVELGVGGPLLSRFDLIFLLWDSVSPQHDSIVASHILEYNNNREIAPLSLDELRAYLKFVRVLYLRNGGPLLDNAASNLITRYYEAQRKRGSSPALADSLPVTVRLLETLVRLTQAHAKLMLQPHCSVWDAAMALFIMERTAHSLKARIGDCVQANGEPLFTHSKELDECFISSSPDAIPFQEQALQLLIKTFGSLPPPSQSISISNMTSQHSLCEGNTALDKGYGGVGCSPPRNAGSNAPLCSAEEVLCGNKRIRDYTSQRCMSGLVTEYDLNDTSPTTVKTKAVYSEPVFAKPFPVIPVSDYSPAHGSSTQLSNIITMINGDSGMSLESTSFKVSPPYVAEFPKENINKSLPIVSESILNHNDPQQLSCVPKDNSLPAYLVTHNNADPLETADVTPADLQFENISRPANVLGWRGFKPPGRKEPTCNAPSSFVSSVVSTSGYFPDPYSQSHNQSAQFDQQLDTSQHLLGHKPTPNPPKAGIPFTTESTMQSSFRNNLYQFNGTFTECPVKHSGEPTDFDLPKDCQAGLVVPSRLKRTPEEMMETFKLRWN